VRAGAWALQHDVSVVIANGFEHNQLLSIIQGKKIGTFFTSRRSLAEPVENQAVKGKTAEENLVKNTSMLSLVLPLYMLSLYIAES
jgi:glutamate 5-kinase